MLILGLARQVSGAWVFVVVLGLAVVALLVPYLIWSLADDTPPVEERATPVALNGEAESPNLWPAEAWVYVWRSIVVHRPMACLARRTLVNSAVVIRLPDMWEPLQFEYRGTSPLHTATFQIPASLVPGLYQYQVTLECRLNPLRIITVRLRDVPIYVGTNPVLETVEERYRALEEQLKALDRYVKPQP